MPFLGNTPANTFVSIAKQTITGNGGTSYSLSYAVTSANDIDVFYNNVRQEPGVAYTANGTTITFTEAIQSTDSVYILFNGQAVGTIDAPAGAYLPTTGGTINGEVIVNNKIQIQQDASSNNRLILRGTFGSSYRWNIDNFGSSNQFRIFRENDSDSSAGMVAAQFDSGGRLILPQQPAFQAYKTTQSSIAANNVIDFNATDLNRGSCFNTSTYRFTAPVSGVYALMSRVQYVSGGTQVYAGTKLWINGSIYAENYTNQYTTDAHTASIIFVLVQMNANDYAYIQTGSFAGTTPTIQAGNTERRTLFTGYLVG